MPWLSHRSGASRGINVSPTFLMRADEVIE
jgi:hypothetical protein